jgi:hypothetical protein
MDVSVCKLGKNNVYVNLSYKKTPSFLVSQRDGLK